MNKIWRKNMRTKDSFGFIRDFVSGRKSHSQDIPFDSRTFDESEVNEGKSLAILAYIPILCFIPFLQGRSVNKYAYEHGKQGVLLFLFEVVALLGALFWKAALFLAAIASLVGIIYVLQGRIWKIPFIGGLADRLDNPHPDEENK